MSTQRRPAPPHIDDFPEQQAAANIIFDRFAAREEIGRRVIAMTPAEIEGQDIIFDLQFVVAGAWRSVTAERIRAATLDRPDLILAAPDYVISHHPAAIEAENMVAEAGQKWADAAGVGDRFASGGLGSLTLGDRRKILAQAHTPLA